MPLHTADTRSSGARVSAARPPQATARLRWHARTPVQSQAHPWTACPAMGCGGSKPADPPMTLPKGTTSLRRVWLSGCLAARVPVAASPGASSAPLLTRGPSAWRDGAVRGLPHRVVVIFDCNLLLLAHGARFCSSPVARGALPRRAQPSCHGAPPWRLCPQPHCFLAAVGVYLSRWGLRSLRLVHRAPCPLTAAACLMFQISLREWRLSARRGRSTAAGGQCGKCPAWRR
jgi:hypothetical protein